MKMIQRSPFLEALETCSEVLELGNGRCPFDEALREPQDGAQDMLREPQATPSGWSIFESSYVCHAFLFSSLIAEFDPKSL